MNKKQEIKKATFNSPREEAYNYINSALGWDVEHIKLNKSAVEKYLQILLPGKVITFIDNTQICISTDTGTIIPHDLDVSKKTLQVQTKRIKSIDDFNENNFKSKYVYIYTMPKENYDDTEFNLRLAEFNPGKKTVSFTIDESIYENFLKLSDKMAINKSKFIENRLIEFLENNS